MRGGWEGIKKLISGEVWEGYEILIFIPRYNYRTCDEWEITNYYRERFHLLSETIGKNRGKFKSIPSSEKTAHIGRDFGIRKKAPSFV